MASLYELTGDFLALSNMADSTDEREQEVFLQTLEAVIGTIDMKMDDYAAVMTEMDNTTKNIDEEIQRLTARKNAISNNLKRMRERLYEVMVATDRRKVKTDLHTFAIQKNGGKLPIIIDQDANVPHKWCKIAIEPDKDMIRAALESGNTEVLSFAHFGERGEHLSIR